MSNLTVRFAHPECGVVDVAVGSTPMVVGRVNGGADIVLGDARVSRRHGRVWVADEAVWYEDLGSRNGSWQAGERLQGAVRVEGHPVMLGETELTVVGAPGMMVRLRLPANETNAASLLSVTRPPSHATALYGFVQTLLTSDGTALMERATAKVREVVVGAERVAIVPWPPSEGPMQPLAGDDMPVSVSLASEAVESGRALLLDDLAASTPQVQASMVRHGIHAAIYVPLIPPEGTAIGVLCADASRGPWFSEDDFQFVRAVGALLATALGGEHARDAARRAEDEARTLQARRDAMAGFLKIASHDLKNPLSVMLMGAQMLRTRRDGPQAEMLVNTMIDAGKRAMNLIHTYLEMAALETGKGVRLERREIEVGPLIDEEIAFARQLAEERGSRGFTFTSRVGCERVTADAERLRQILGNLLSNAIKYSPRGGEIALEVDGGPDGATFRVRDQGVGIAAADQQRLFTQFERIGTKVADGVGLGLWLTAALVKAHGGRIWVESEPGQGSTFAFTLPG